MLACRVAIASLVAGLLLLGGPVEVAGAAESQSGAGRVPLPDIPRGQGETCVAETSFMRRNHMVMLRHQRDETMRQGIRGNPYSIEQCIACHVVEGPDSVPLTVSSPRHFCRACHDYAAVSIDCFQCHASRPEPGMVTGHGAAPGGSMIAGVGSR